MSKIAVSPNGSGTGTYTLASPNNNASHTITLPVATGELLVNTATGVDVTGTVTMDGGSTSGDFTFGDNDKAIFGAGSDLQIYHDGQDSYIKDAGTGRLKIIGNDQVRLENTDGDAYLAAVADGSTFLYYAGSNKFSTTSTGIDVTGTVTATAYTGDGSALTGVGPSTTAGAVGTYVFARGALSTGSRQFVWNSTYSGSGLYPAGPSAFVGATGSGSTWNTSGYGMAAGYYLASALTGTWRCLGHTHPTYDNPVTLFVRIS